MIALVPDAAVLRSKVAWGRGTMLLAASLALIEAAIRGRIRLHWPGFLLAALVPGLVALAWLRGPAEFSRALAHDEILRLLSVPVAAWTIASCVPSPSARRAFVAVLLLSVIPVAGYALAQKLAGTLDLPVGAAARATSTFGNPVFLGAFLVLVTPFCAAGAVFGSGFVRWAGALATGLALPALLATESRWAWLGCAVSLGAGIVLLAPTARWRRRLLVGLLIGGVLLAAVSTRVLLRPQGHALIWRDTLRMIASHPWGVGPGQFDVSFLPWASPELLQVFPRQTTIINDAHCELLQVFAELGWPGLLAVLAAFIALLLAARSTLRGLAADDPERPWLIASLTALAGSTLQSFGSPDLRFMVSTLLFATVAGFAASFAAPRVLEARPASRALLVALGLLGIAAAVQMTRSSLEIAALVRPPQALGTSVASAARLDDLRQLVLERPDDPDAQYRFGVALAEQHRYASSAEAFRKTVQLSGGNPAAVRSLGIMESMSGQYTEALPHLRATLDANRDDIDVRYCLAYAAYGLGDIKTAIAELETLLAARPDHPQARLLLERLRE